MKKPPIRQQRLEDLEREFSPLLVACLNECSCGRWGLFEQNSYPEAERYLHWKEARHLKEIADEIHDLRAEFGQPNALVERYLYYYSQRGANAPGEPRLAAAFLDEIQRGDFVLHSS